jgi:hypothetical protein
MTVEAANDILKARDEMTEVEIALATVVQDLQRRVIRLERDRDNQDTDNRNYRGRRA